MTTCSGKPVMGGKTWTQVANIQGLIPAGICGISVVNSSVIYGCGIFQGPAHVIKTSDGGKSWTSIDMSQNAGTLTDCYFLSPDSGFVVGGTSGNFPTATNAVILFTADGGETWEEKLVEDDVRVQGIGFVSSTDRDCRHSSKCTPLISS